MDPRLVDLLQQVADKLGQTVEVMWPEIVRAYVARAMVDISISAILLVMAAIAAPLVLRKWVDVRKQAQTAYRQAVAESAKQPFGHYVSRLDYDTIGWDAAAALVVGGLLFVALMCILTIDSALPMLFAPEGQAALKLLGR